MKRSIKHLLAHGLFVARLDSLLLRDAAVVVTFHRVQDRGPDPLTITTDLFERYCRFFKRHFRVTTLGDLIRRLEHRLPLERALVVTFDDGYRDNLEHAAPILEKVSVPATFFVVTGWIGTDIVPWWDHQRGVRHPWMTWDEVCELRRRGFDIGAHTRSHVDLGAVPTREAREEILGSRHDLEDRLGARVDSFAYPYGGRHHLRDAARALVKEAGFRCCCGGFGGVNATGADPFSLRRVPISTWYTAPHDFGFDIVLGRSALSKEALLTPAA